MVGGAAAFEKDAVKRGTPVERIARKFSKRERNADAFQLRTAGKGLLSDAFERIRKGEIAQAGASKKHT